MGLILPISQTVEVGSVILNLMSSHLINRADVHLDTYPISDESFSQCCFFTGLIHTYIHATWRGLLLVVGVACITHISFGVVTCTHVTVPTSMLLTPVKLAASYSTQDLQSFLGPPSRPLSIVGFPVQKKLRQSFLWHSGHMTIPCPTLLACSCDIDVRYRLLFKLQFILPGKVGNDRQTDNWAQSKTATARTAHRTSSKVK